MNDKNDLKLMRIIASLIDGLFIYVLFFAVIFPSSVILYNETQVENPQLLKPILTLVCSILMGGVLSIIYLVVPTIVFKGSTIGMKMSGIKFVNVMDERFPIRHLIIRESLVVFTLIFTFTISVVANFLAVLFNKDGKTYFDYATYAKVVMCR